MFTIGHSTREIGEFIDILKEHSITLLVDIRTIPKSRHNPQYGQAEIESSLRENGIEYAYLKSLGGLRSSSKNSINDAWRNKSFRNYADYMQTDEFENGLTELMSLSENRVSAIMCAEAVPWRCHRSLVSDALVVRGVLVNEIIGSGTVREHSLTTFAVVDGTKIIYPKSAVTNDDKHEK
jgi:uncharacterized protein (DUF488 family)